MENKITITEIHVTNHVEIQVVTDGSINMKDMFSLNYADVTYYFKPIDLKFTVHGTTAILKETGYWSDRLYNLSGIDYKNLIGLSISVITDMDVIKEIKNKSTLC